ncbi:hypothetical protein N7488_008409 [Penicillium malachiteum]|nr:hypothetical protein N7488_008409 [Penicillium malachiteum]
MHCIHFPLNENINVCDRLEPNPLRLVLITPTTQTSSRWHEIEAATASAQPQSSIPSSNVSLHPRPVSSASAAINSATQTAFGKLNTQPSTPALSNICHAVYSCSPPNKSTSGISIGHLFDGKYIHDSRVMKADAGSLEMKSLEQILFASLPASGSPHTPLFILRKERCSLAAKLASTVLECHGSWLPSNWSSRSIIFTEKITPANFERTVRAPVIVHKLFDPPDFQGYPLSWTRHNELLSPLGLALIELSLCRPFTYPHSPNDQTVDEISTLFEMARNWTYDVSCESGPRYGDVVQQCLFWTKTRELDMESEEFQASVFQYIIKPLVEDFNQFDDV